MTAPWRACRAVAVISRTSWSKVRPGSCTAIAARPWTWAWLGITSTRRPPSCSAVRAAISATRTESASLGSSTTSVAPHEWMASRSCPVEGRRPGPPSDDDGAGLLEERGQAGARRDGDDGALAGGRGPTGLGDLLGEVRDPDPVRAARVDARLDRRAHVVDVDVDVPQASPRRPRRGCPRGCRARCAGGAIASSSASRRYITS